MPLNPIFVRRPGRRRLPALLIAASLAVLPMLRSAAASDAALLDAHALRAAGDFAAARRAYAQVVADTNALPAVRSIAQLSLAQSYRDTKDWRAAERAYAAVGDLPGVPAHHRIEAQAQRFALQRLAVGEPADDPAAGRGQFPSRPTPAREFHVAPGGSDANPGTPDRPFASLERAREAIRAVKAATGLPDGGVAVVVHGGHYAVRRTFELTAADSGSLQAPVVYRAAEGDRPVFSGGARIKDFEPVRDPAILARLPEGARGRVLQADLRRNGVTNVPPVRVGGFASGAGFRSHPALEVFFDGAALPLARWPNAGFVKVAEARGPTALPGGGPAGTKEGVIRYTEERPGRWQDDKDILLYGYWFYGWADSYERVATIDPAKREITLAPPFHGYGYRAGQPFKALNLLSEIDEPGEWYLDRASLRLYLLPPSDPAGAVVEVSLLEQPLVELADVSHLWFEGLTWELGCTDAIRLHGGQGCVLAGCTIRRSGGNGLEIEGGHGHVVRSSDLHSMGRGGVVLTGGDRRTLTPGDHRIENCHVFDLSRLDRTYTPAVLLNGVGLCVAHNLFHDVPSSALRVEGNDHRIEFNEIARVVTESDDQGGVDMFGNPTYRGNVYRFNYFHHIGAWRNPSQEPDCGQAGIRLDDMISGTLVYGNLFRRCASGKLGFGGVQIHGGKENVLDNNLFVDCATAVSFSPWGEAGWRERTAGALDAPAIDRALYLQRYPDLGRLPEDRNVNHLWRNLVVNSGEFLRRNGGGARLLSNHVAAKDTASFPEGEKGVFHFDAAGALAARAGFQPLPFDAIGLYRDAYRRALPAERIAALRTGF